jgi:hypothetical protein
MQISELVEVLCAAHLGQMVDFPFTERGGVMLVGPPGVLKTTFVSVLDKTYQDCIMLSDVNVKSLVQLRDNIASGKINTLVLPELAKLYERADVTAKNVEGTLRALVAEGFTAASFEDSRINRLTARCMVIAALTPSIQNRHFTEWEESGFNRRFLWALVKLADPLAIERAVLSLERINFRYEHVPMMPLNGSIPNRTTLRERQQLASMVKYQPGGDHAIQLQVMIRTMAVLRWWYAERGLDRRAMDTMEAFAPALGKTGVELQLPKTDKVEERMEVDMVASRAASQLARKRWSGQHANGKKKK